MARWVLAFVAVLAVQAQGSVVSDFVEFLKGEFVQAEAQAEKYINQFRQEMEGLAKEEYAKIKTELLKAEEELKSQLADIIAKGEGDVECAKQTVPLIEAAVKELEADSLNCLTTDVKSIDAIVEDMVAQVKEAVDTVSHVQSRLSACLDHPLTSISCAMKVVDETQTTLGNVRNNITSDVSQGVNIIVNIGEHVETCLGGVYNSIPAKVQGVKDAAAPCFKQEGETV